MLGPDRTELLAPARDLACGRVAIACGADAVYIGPQAFGARAAAGNSLQDIEALVHHAHLFHARVYATLNTLLTDPELQEAVRLARSLWDVGVDALIVQDMGLVDADLPPIPLFASTQCHNHSPERVAFLEAVGFQRVILARELDLEAVARIRARTGVELEAFVHGALCAGYSGRCHLSLAMGHRSANRGTCAQPCRLPWTLRDGEGRVLARDRHLLSMKDLDRTRALGDLLDVGVRSFKIEGRLKDPAYVGNVVAWYRARLDEAMASRSLRSASSGRAVPGFNPDPSRTFNRGFTDLLDPPWASALGSPDSPKSVGQPVGRVKGHVGTGPQRDTPGMVLEGGPPLHPGDGLCWMEGELVGASVVRVQEGPPGAVFLEGRLPPVGARVFRNRDAAFLKELLGGPWERRLRVGLALRRDQDGALALTATDEDGTGARVPVPSAEPARQPEAAREAARRQLLKSGHPAFSVDRVDLDVEPFPFLALSAWNGVRRSVLESLEQARRESLPRWTRAPARGGVPCPTRELDFRDNVLNRAALDFYRRWGARVLEPAAEKGLDLRGRVVMTTRHCTRALVGLCPRTGESEAGPLYLVGEGGRRFLLTFHCDRCEMEVILAEPG